MTLKDSVYNSVINLHNKTKKEWLSLKEIYEEVEVYSGNKLKNGGASVRAILERHCSSSEVFSGNELYVSKEIRSGLYKAAVYEQQMIINNLVIGDIFSKEQLMSLFKISGQSGIMKTNTFQCLVLITAEGNGVYQDGVLEDGHILYTGEGLTGDQTISKNNKTIYESTETNIPMYLFSKDKKRRYVFEGKVRLCDDPYQKEEKDINGNLRLVWKFPLCITDNSEYSNSVSEIVQIENKSNYSDSFSTNSLEFRDGLVNIRKYRKNNIKKYRSEKPNYIDLEITRNKQGIINEKAIFERELEILIEAEATEQVKKMEEFFANKKDNEGFDILSFELDENGEYMEKYIEVKSTKNGEETPIDISAAEIEFAKNHIDNYYLYRIVNSESDQRYFKIIKGVDLFKESNYDFVPTSYKIYTS